MIRDRLFWAVDVVWTATLNLGLRVWGLAKRAGHAVLTATFEEEAPATWEYDARDLFDPEKPPTRPLANGYHWGWRSDADPPHWEPFQSH